MNMGESGYIDTCHKIVGAAKKIEDAIRENPKLRNSLQVIGKPMVSVVAFRAPIIVDGAKNAAASPADAVDIYSVADGMSAKGWHLNALQDPPAIHVAVTLPIVAAVEDLIKDLEEVVESVRGQVSDNKGDAAALYGVAGALPDKSIVEELAGGFLDCLYKV
jgi:sphinganine-1-phosphate aldolase